MDNEMMNGLQAMSRNDLIKFAVTALETIERLEKSNEQYKNDLEAAGTVDTSVIWQWREWLGKMDEERDQWAVLATKTSEENKTLKAENKKLLDRTSKILEMLDDISKYTNSEVDGNKPPSFLLGVIIRIKKSINIAKSSLIEFIVDEPITENIEQPSTEQQLSLQAVATEQQPSNA